MGAITLADVLVAGGFIAVVAGIHLTFGAGVAFMVGGVALVWTGGRLYTT